MGGLKLKNINDNWGFDNTKEKIKGHKRNDPRTWGQIKNTYNSGYSDTLKFMNILNAFVVPFVLYGLVGAMLADRTDGASFALALIGYVFTSFSLWLNLSYKAKLFENVSKLAQNSEAILYELQNKGVVGNDE